MSYIVISLAVLDERLEIWAQYDKYKPIRQKLDKVKPGKGGP